jgi:hypothetical protein
MTPDELQAHIDKLCTAHDRYMAEEREWLAERRRSAAPLVQKSAEGEVLHREYDGNAPAAVPVAYDVPSDGELSEEELMAIPIDGPLLRDIIVDLRNERDDAIAAAVGQGAGGISRVAGSDRVAVGKDQRA